MKPGFLSQSRFQLHVCFNWDLMADIRLMPSKHVDLFIVRTMNNAFLCYEHRVLCHEHALLYCH